MNRDDRFGVPNLNPDDEWISRLEMTDAESIYEAVQLYRKFHRGDSNITPTLSELIEWLVWLTQSEHGGSFLERMGWIHNTLVDLGDVSPDEVVLVPGATILLLSIFSDVTPFLLHKRKSSTDSYERG